MSKSKIFLFLSLASIFLFTTCKKKYRYKYPESTYKWGDPAKPEFCPFYGKITKYMVNGIDSLDLLDKYIDTAYIRLNGNVLHIKDGVFEFHNERAHEYNLTFVTTNGKAESYRYEFNSNRKKIKILRNLPGLSSILHRPLFISNEIEWEIVRLSKDDKPFKIRTTLNNGNNYEIQIR